MRSARLKEMELYITEHEFVKLEALCKRFGVSINTVRSDFDELCARLTVKNGYGGVTVR